MSSNFSAAVRSRGRLFIPLPNEPELSPVKANRCLLGVLRAGLLCMVLLIAAICAGVLAAFSSEKVANGLCGCDA